MASLEQIDITLNRVEALANDILLKMQVIASMVYAPGGLSDITEDLGLVKAGEFRSGKGEPGFGFTGIRMGAPGWTFASGRYAIAGVNNDALQFGLSVDDGSLYAGEGSVRLNSAGLTIEFGVTGGQSIRWMDTAVDWNEEMARISAHLVNPGIPVLDITLQGNAGWLEVGLEEAVAVNRLISFGNITYEGTILFRGAGGDEHLGGIVVPCNPSLTSTSWDGDAKSTTAFTLLDMQTVFGLPPGIKGVFAVVSCRDSGSAAALDLNVTLAASATSKAGLMVRPAGVTNDALVSGSGFCPCNADGDLYYSLTASGAGTLDVWIEVTGYII
jgi:hypothetical protein